MVKLFLEFERLRSLYTGLGQFCFHLGEHLKTALPHNFEVAAWMPKNKSNVFGSRFHQVVTQSTLGKLFLSFKRFDLWHCVHQDSKFLPRHPKTKLIFTIHDLNFLFRIKDEKKRRRKLQALQKRINRAQAITTISHYTKSLVEKHLTLDKQLIRVIHNGCKIDQSILPQKPAALEMSSYVFTLGAISPIKNTHVLVDMLAKLPEIKLVIAGNNVDKVYMEKLLESAKSIGVSERIQFLGAISEAEKYWLYENCTAFVFPSLFEGFGMPPIEAMNFGKPVFLSTRQSLPEIGGKLAYFWDNFDSDSMAKIFLAGMQDFLEDKNKSKKMKEWAETFSWEKSASAYAKLYQDLLNGPS